MGVKLIGCVNIEKRARNFTRLHRPNRLVLFALHAFRFLQYRHLLEDKRDWWGGGGGGGFFASHAFPFLFSF